MMRKLLALVLICIIAFSGLLAGCTREPLQPGDENAETRTYDFTDFTAVEAESAFIIEVVRADSFSIDVTAGKNIINRINVTKDGNTLKLGLDGWSWLWFWRATPTARITMPALTGLKLSGATQADVQGFRSNDDLNLEISGASMLDFTDTESGSLDAEISGASRVQGSLVTGNSIIELSGASLADLTGETADMRVSASGASTANLASFPADNADVDFSGASHGEVNVSGDLDVTLSGASRLRYSGNPQLGRVDVTGASSLDNANSDNRSQ